jgi:cytochrome c553
MDEIMAEKGTDVKGVIGYKAELREKLRVAVETAFAPHKQKQPKANTRLEMDPATWPNSGMGRFNPDGSLGTCNACHPRHEFSKALARQPENCGKCHMGPDHPQIEIYNESKHGIAFRNQLAEMNLDHPEWVVGRDYSAAPTCATCHMSAYRTAEGIRPVNHDVGLRVSWTLRPEVSVLTTSKTATIDATGEVAKRDVRWDEKRNDMKGVCAACHSTSHVEGFYAGYDALVMLYNEKFGKPSWKLMKHIADKGYLSTPEVKGFGHELTYVYYELWHHEGRRMRHGASMMGPDYTHWHGGYEVSKHFYTEFLPLVRELAEEKGDEELLGMIATELARPEHEWRDGQDRAEAQRVREHYRTYFGMKRPGE